MQKRAGNDAVFMSHGFFETERRLAPRNRAISKMMQDRSVHGKYLINVLEMVGDHSVSFLSLPRALVALRFRLVFGSSKWA